MLVPEQIRLDLYMVPGICLEHTTNFGWQDQTGSVVPLHKFSDCSSSLVGTVLLDKMACFWEHLQLILALHLPNHEFSVKPVSAGKDEEFAAVCRQKSI